MNGERAGLLALSGIVLGIFVIGFWLALALYKYDTYDCTNLCGGKHSIYNNNACYCKIGD